MRKLKPRCLLAALLLLIGCAPSAPLLTPQTRPQLDQYLASDCAALSQPPVGDYDALEAWVLDELIVSYTDCAIRHRKTVDSWPK